MHGTHMHHNHAHKRRARVARRMMMKRRMGMMAAMGRGPWADDEGESWGPSNEEKLRWLEEYQRDLEEETANVVTRIADLKAKADTPTDA